MKVLLSGAGKVISQRVPMPINGEERGRMEKVIAQTSKWKITLKETLIEVDLYDLVFSDREVMSILDAYKKAYDTRHLEMKSRNLPYY
jgi:hypothetical protein